MYLEGELSTWKAYPLKGKLTAHDNTVMSAFHALVRTLMH